MSPQELQSSQPSHGLLWAATLLLICSVTIFPASILPLRICPAQEVPPGEAPLTPRWRILVNNSRPRAGTAAIPEDAFVRPLAEFEMTGPRPGDQFLLGNFRVDGAWGVVNGDLARVQGKNAALQLAVAEDFHMEAVVSAEGLGGWFLLLGWDEGNGYAIYNVNLKTSGSPWLVTEFRGFQGVEETHREFKRYECKGFEPLEVLVKDKRLSLRVGTTILAEQMPLENYHAGKIIVGTYDTTYGPKDVRIRMLRIRQAP